MATYECPECKGQGQLIAAATSRTGEPEPELFWCDSCDGTGEVEYHDCVIHGEGEGPDCVRC